MRAPNHAVASPGLGGLVATPHALASAAGARALRMGGSAVDAAVAANAVLGVVYPHMAGLGGDAFWLVWDPDDEAVHALEAAGPAARLATRSLYAERGLAAVPERGPLAALTVPGAIDGWRLAHERYGRLPWPALLEDATRYAMEGAPVASSLARALARERALLASDATTAHLLLGDGRVPVEGETLPLPDLAWILVELASAGARDGFYEGAPAKRVAAACEAAGSPLRAEDFSAYHATWTSPVTTEYRGLTLVETPPPTQGVTALALLNLLERFDVADLGEGSADWYHTLAECVKLAFADRDEHVADPRFGVVPVEWLASKERAAERAALVDAARAAPWNAPVLRPAFEGDTVAFQAVDAGGLLVSAIQSIYHPFGSAFAPEGLLLQNRGAFFRLDARHPNRLEPGKRTLHTLTPAMLLRHHDPVLAFGTMGGEGQPQTQAQILLRLVDHHFGLEEAVRAPRALLGRAWGDPTRALRIEGRVPQHVLDELARRGHDVVRLADFDETTGHAQAILLRSDGMLEGTADPRGDGAAIAG